MSIRTAIVELNRNYEGVKLVESDLSEEEFTSLLSRLHLGTPTSGFIMVHQNGTPETLIQLYSDLSNTDSSQFAVSLVFKDDNTAHMITKYLTMLGDKIGYEFTTSSISESMLFFRDFSGFEHLVQAHLTKQPIVIVHPQEKYIREFIRYLFSLFTIPSILDRSILSYSHSPEHVVDILGVPHSDMIKDNSMTTVDLSKRLIQGPYKSPLSKKITKLVQSAKINDFRTIWTEIVEESKNAHMADPIQYDSNDAKIYRSLGKSVVLDRD